MKKSLLSVLLVLCLLTSCTETEETPVSSAFAPATPPDAVSSASPTPSPTPEPQDITVTLSFGGDILCHTPIFTTAAEEDGTYDFSSFLQYGMTDFFHADFNLANMENPVDAYGNDEKISSYPGFNAPNEIADFALAYGIDTVTFCNNHVYDKGYSGFCRTIENLRESGLATAGGYLNEEEYNTPEIYDVKGIKIGLLSYTYLVNSRYGYYKGEIINTLEPYSVRTFVQNVNAAEAMSDEMQKLREAGAELVIVYLHWGNEYKDSPTAAQKNLAHALCEGGADILVGGHSHCVQPMERYTRSDGSESLIFYSLGNLFADQHGLSTENYGADIRKTQYGVKVNVTVTKDAHTGQVSLTGGDYEPTCLLRGRKNGKYDYYYLASGRYALKETADELFPDTAMWQKCITAYEHVTKILGTDVLPVHVYE